MGTVGTMGSQASVRNASLVGGVGILVMSALAGFGNFVAVAVAVAGLGHGIGNHLGSDVLNNPG